jgi:hypothetical protein
MVNIREVLGEVRSLAYIPQHQTRVHKASESNLHQILPSLQQFRVSQ